MGLVTFQYSGLEVASFSIIRGAEQDPASPSTDEKVEEKERKNAHRVSESRGKGRDGEDEAVFIFLDLNGIRVRKPVLRQCYFYGRSG